MGLCVTLTNLEAKRILLRYSFFPGVIDVEHHARAVAQPEAAKIIRFLPDLQNYYL